MPPGVAPEPGRPEQAVPPGTRPDPQLPSGMNNVLRTPRVVAQQPGRTVGTPQPPPDAPGTPATEQPPAPANPPNN
jgi:hypothetical protein